MEQFEIKSYGELTPNQREKVTEIVIEGFAHILKFAKSKQELKVLLSDAFHPEQTFACLKDGQVLGMMGVATSHIRPIQVKAEACSRVYGKLKGGILYRQLNMIFQSQIVKGDRELYIDMLGTAGEARGRGVATRLLKYALSMEGYDMFYLDVFSKNQKAKHLYEQLGFSAYRKQRISYLSLMGYGYPIKMKLV